MVHLIRLLIGNTQPKRFRATMILDLTNTLGFPLPHLQVLFICHYRQLCPRDQRIAWEHLPQEL
jgi:hypothetical protein